MRYRILERKWKRNYKPFGVAYKVEKNQFILDVPGWRSPALLRAGRLEELSERHFPSSREGYRWTPVMESKKGERDFQKWVFQVLARAYPK